MSVFLRVVRQGESVTTAGRAGLRNRRLYFVRCEEHDVVRRGIFDIPLGCDSLNILPVDDLVAGIITLQEV